MKFRALLFLFILLLIGCGDESDLKSGKDVSKLYLPDLYLLYPNYESVDSTKAYGRLAHKLLAENRDLQASQMYIDAAWFFYNAGNLDSVAYSIHRAIDHGMANPKILNKFISEEEIPETSTWKHLEDRLDSIQQELQKISHFSVEMEAINQFWSYFDRARKDSSNAKEIFKEYIFNGPPEVRDYYFARYESTSNMYGQMINGTPEYYEYLKNFLSPDSLTMINDVTTSWMRNFRSHYPQAVFPKVFVVPGILNSGGTATEMGMFVGGDMYGRSDKMPLEGLTEWQKGAIMKINDLPKLTMHELMHFQQNYKDPVHGESVLMGVIGEGVCDFLVELSSGITLQNENLSYLADESHRKFILDELRRDLFITDNSRWLYNGGSIEDRPADMGYTMGYLITKSYYHNQPDKIKAVYELLNTKDVTGILAGSDYAFLLEPQPDDETSNQ